MNVMENISVTLMLHARTPLGVTSVNAMKDSMEMDSTAQVSLFHA